MAFRGLGALQTGFFGSREASEAGDRVMKSTTSQMDVGKTRNACLDVQVLEQLPFRVG